MFEKTAFGIELDGVLAEYTGWKGDKHIGKPVTKYVNKVKKLLKDKEKVVILSTRVYGKNTIAKKAIEEWSKEHIGEVLPIAFDVNASNEYLEEIK